MAEDYGIFITQPGQSVVNAPANSILMDTSKPFIKLDTQNPAAFPTTLLLITNDPPEPVSPAFADVYTVLHKFKHGYTYVPTIETLFVVLTPAPNQVSGTFQLYFYDYGLLARGFNGSPAGGAILYACADATWVYYIVQKFNQDGISPTLLSGTSIQITSHVFVEDIGV